MMLALHSVVGTIRVEPLAREAESPAECDDSTLGLLLESLAFHETLAAGPIHLRLRTRLSRFQSLAERQLAVRANLPQLERDLAADYEQLEFAAGSRPA
jgi:hypothetical protein